jgi:hypothetical protein
MTPQRASSEAPSSVVHMIQMDTSNANQLEGGSQEQIHNTHEPMQISPQQIDAEIQKQGQE